MTVFVCVCVCVCFFFLSQLENSLIRDCFSVFWMEQSITSPYFFRLLPICPGGLAWSRSSSAFVKKRIGLCFTDGNMWPSKISNGPPKKSEGSQTWPSIKITDLGTTLSLHRRMYYPRYYLPKFKAYIKRWDPQFQ